MDNSWASQNLQVIRTLMERAAVYRRALAPVMIVTGAMGLIGAGAARFTHITSPRTFSLYWMFISLAALLVSFFLVRRQAWKAKEPFWSPPTRRVTQALSPAFLAGLIAGCLWIKSNEQMSMPAGILAATWMVCYGCGLHAAGFFMVRGIKFFGWILVLTGCLTLVAVSCSPTLQSTQAAHNTMGACFGLLHLAYGIYLYFTERTKSLP